MNRKEKTQQNRFDTKIAPLVEELTKLCEKFGMPMLTSVQLFENEADGARVNTVAAHPLEMSIPMTLSTSLMNGSTRVRIDDNNTIQLIMHRANMPDVLKPYTLEPQTVENSEYDEDDLELLTEHVEHCDDCKLLMDEAVERGERVDNIVVPRHEDAGLIELLDELKKSKIPFVMPKNNNIH